MERKDLTTIQLHKATLIRLRSLKIVKKESYDELLNRLINRILGYQKNE